MDCECSGGNPPGNCVEQSIDVRRRANANGIPERNFVAAERIKRFCDANNILRRDETLVGTADNTRDIPAYGEGLLGGSVNYFLSATEAVGNGTTYIGLREALGRGEKHGDLASVGCSSCGETSQVRDENAVSDASATRELRHEFRRRSHLWNTARRNEASAFDVRDTRIYQGFDEREPGGNRKVYGFIL
jgi:hypothetical protein